MSMKDSAARVEIPGQQTFWSGPIVPPMEVRLPLAAQARLPWVVCSLVPLALVGWLATIAVVMRPFISVPSMSFGAVVGTTVAMAVLAVFGWLCTATLVTVLADWSRDDPVLVIGAQGVEDRRSGAPMIAWSDVISAQAIYQSRIRGEDRVFQPDASVFAVLLTLRHKIAARHNPFRLGTLFFRRRRLPNELYVSVVTLSVSAHVLAYSMMVLVRRHGGAIQPRLPDRDPGLR